MEGQFRQTYISENALMPSQVYSNFRESEWNYLRAFREELKIIFNFPPEGRNFIIEPWISNKGYKTSIHEPSDTLYGIMHASRGDDSEAILLCAPWKTDSGMDNFGGVAVAVALARYFEKLSIWSKNIILVFPQDARGLQEWVESYHSDMELTGGSIEAAIVLEYPSDKDRVEYVEIEYEGINGQLPNLDLINTVVNVAQHEGFRVSIQGMTESELHRNDYPLRLQTLGKGIINSALSGVLRKSGCEAFSGWNIQSITLKAIQSESRQDGGAHDITTFGRVVESSFRSVNNLLEKFHQSFFFYLMLSPNHFVSISSYLPSAVGVAISFALASVARFLGANRESPTKSIVIFLAVCAATAISAVLKSYTIALVAIPLVALRRGKLNHLIQAIALFHQTLLIACLSVADFSLALCVGVCSFPMALQPSRPAKGIMCLALSCPLFWMCVVAYQQGISFHELSGSLYEAWSRYHALSYGVLTYGWMASWVAMCVSFVQM